jgi:uncharacterized protein YbaR (Trm112 family)
MRTDTLDILRCPYCGGRLALAASAFHRRAGSEIEEGVLQCACCAFPVVAGIPVMHLEGAAAAARDHIVAGRPDLAQRAMFDLAPEHAERFEAVAASETITYREVLDALGPTYERQYFLYRFSDPSYVVAHALIRAVAGTVLRTGGRAIDICGGSGHLTRPMMTLSTPPPVLADLYFGKLWLARRFTAPGCEAVCCTGNAPFPFARGVFGYAMCADAFMFIWPKRQFVLEMLRLVDDGRELGAAVISHTHNQRQWSPSLGQPLPPEGYRDLFETLEPRIFSERGLFDDVVNDRPLDLARRDPAEVVDADPALVLVASSHPDVFRPHALGDSPGVSGELRLNPLYVAEPLGEQVRLRLQFPSPDYEDEFGACRAYLPDAVVIERASLALLEAGRLPPELADLARRRVILDLPKRYC